MDIKTLGSRVGGYFAISALALAISACDDDTVESVSGSDSSPSSYAVVSAPVGSISGVVQDTNGNGIPGATVRVGNKSATTDEDGRYYFENVPVTQTKSQDDAEVGAVYQQALTVSVKAPSGFLSGTVTVWPQAQVFSASDNNDASSATTVFINGFSAEAGTAVLPALGAELTGVARDAETGAVLANTAIHLDMLGTLDSDGNLSKQQQAEDGVSYSYATGDYTATTDADGKFTFTGLPDDSAFIAGVAGYSIQAKDINGVNVDYVDTMLEMANESFELVAAPFVSTDDISPFVVKVGEVITQTAATGRLNDDFGNTLTIEFSENLDIAKVDDTNVNSIIIRDKTAEQYLRDVDGNQFTAQATGNILTVVFHAGVSIAAGSELEIFLLKDDFTDVEGNVLATGASVGFDSNISSASNADYVKLALVTFEETNLDPTEITAYSQLDTDNGVDNFVLEASGYTAFKDVNNDAVAIQGINSADDDDGLNSADADERLTALGTALLSAAEYDTTGFEVLSTVARLTFTPEDASNYSIEVTRNLLPVVASVDKVVNGDYDVTVADRLVVDDASADVDLVISGVQEGDLVKITPYDDFDYAGTATTITLVDNVAPIPVLQKAYGSSANADLDDATGEFDATYGAGGEVVIAGSGNVLGYPILNVSPNLLALRDGSNDGVNGTDINGNATTGIDEFVDLLSYNTINAGSSAFSGAAPGEQFIQMSVGNTNPQVYDANAYADYVASADLSRIVGVAMSEDIQAVANTSPAYTPTGATVSNWTIVNDVTVDDDGDAVNVDLMAFTISDVLGWSLADNDSVIDFAGAITDTAGNSASTESKVVVKDAIPPFVESAVFTGSSIQIVFNEGVDLSESPVITIANKVGGSTNITLDLTSGFVAQSQTNVADDTVTISSGAWGYDMDLDVMFDLARYNEASPTSSPTNNYRYLHSILKYNAVKDANGNSWDNYTTITEADYTVAPDFAIVNDTDDFSVTNPVLTSFAGGNTTAQVSWTFGHAIDLCDLLSGGNACAAAEQNGNLTTLSAVRTAAILNLTSATSIDTSGATSATLGNNGQVLTVNLTFNAAIATGDELDLQSNAVPSGWDASQVIDPNPATAQ